MRFSAWSVLWILVVVPAAATAQTNLYLLRSAEPFSSCLPPGCSPDRGALIQIDADAGRISSITPIPNARGPHQQLGVTPDGRYVTWSGADARTVPVEPPFLDSLTLFDRVTGATGEAFRLPPPTVIDTPSTTLLPHPRRPEVLARLGGRPPLAVAASGIRSLTAGCETPFLENLTGDGGKVLLRCPDAAVVVDADTGLEVHRLVAPALRWAISGDGTELFRVSTTSGSHLITRLSVATGAVLAARTLDAGDVARELWIDRRTGRLFVELATGVLVVLANDTLDILWRVAPRLPALVPSDPFYHEPVTIRRIAFDRGRPRAFMLATRHRQHPLPPPWGYEAQIDVIDTDALMLTDGATLLLDAPVADLALVPLPPRPVAFSATVQASHVTLQWAPGTDPGAATHYRVEVSLSPGGPYGALETPLTSIAGAVPNGTYFVRVRGVNFGGVGPSSEEIVVRVPQ